MSNYPYNISNSLLMLFKRGRDCVGLTDETAFAYFGNTFSAAVVGTK